MNYIIGCGGVGSWLAPSLCKLVGRENITLIDGDTLEEKNMDRQLFSDDDLGAKKSDSLAKRYGCQSIPEWYYTGLVSLERNDWLLVCVDNHPARLAALESCDHFKCCCIIAANETHSSEAYFYMPQWNATPLDPRVYYPEISTVKANDPRNRAIGCTGKAQEENRQLVSANFSAAALAQHLYVVWAMEAKRMDRDAKPFLPNKLVCNLTSMAASRVCDYKEKETK